VKKYFGIVVENCGEFSTFTLSNCDIYPEMKRFIGDIDAKADVKGRVFVPAAFRKILSESGNEYLVLKKDIFQDCLVLYPGSVWNDELDTLRSKLNKYDEEQQQLFRQFVFESETLEIDANGRILIPKRYMQLANIDKEVRFVGIDYTIEIWSKSKLDKPLLDNDTFRAHVKKFLG
jgi:Uncharacterized protein conserved in bacteria